ncbi:hypothetical protein [Corynebacterium lowii]|uniref:Uncharacterized protein n=1 Tax=Corynebacterium lowii TaxID=1544413 RepID=A0A0Q1E281_9CORY|nr:hypothetical protein [Corynebacterium lowii]KQB86662.1 hypothetical protein Clow_00870 [Corynebacterium lowii]MDP9851347.1 hypothetical protein [Corynebacterium lowii]
MSEEYVGQRRPMLIGGSDSFVSVELAAAYPQGTILNESVDPLRDFMDCERILGFAHTGESEWERKDYPIGSAALWEVHDYYHRPRMLSDAPEAGEWATFLLTVAVIGDRLPLRPFFAVWEVVLAGLTDIEPTSLTMHVSNKSSSYWQPLRPEYVIRSHAYRDENARRVFQEVSAGAEHASCRVMNSAGESLAVNCKRFSPLRLVESFELLSPGLERDTVGFWIKAFPGLE